MSEYQEFKNEAQMQNHIVVWFSQKYPKHYGALFEVNNTVLNIKHAMHRRGMGMVAGASDLVLFVNNIFAGIELKHPKTKHSKEHLEQQKKWGKYIESQGGIYIMSQDVEQIKNFIDEIINSGSSNN